MMQYCFYNQFQQTIMKLRTFFITLTSFSLSHCLRIAFSFNKNNIEKKYNVDDFFLGTLDAVCCLMYAFGALLYYELIDRKKILQIYMKFSFGATISGSFYAVLSLFFQTNLFENQEVDQIIKKIILIICLGAFGFFNFTVWPLNLCLLSNYFNPQNDGAWIGFWGSGWELGNILSLLISSLMVYSWNFRWESTILLFAFLNLVSACLVYFFLQNPHSNIHVIKKDDFRSIEAYQKIKEQQITSKQFYKFCRNALTKKQSLIFIILNGLISTVFMSLLFWIPIYMSSLNYEHFSGYLTITLEVFAIFGALYLGKLEEHKNQNKMIATTLFKFYLQKYTTQIATLIAIGMSFIWLFGPQNIWLYGILIGFFGFFIGGLFNTMHSNQIFQFTENNVSRTQMFAVLLLVTNSLILSGSSFLIGFIINQGNQYNQNKNQEIKFKKSYQNLFIVILVVLIGILFLFVEKRKFKNQKERKEKNQNSFYQVELSKISFKGQRLSSQHVIQKPQKNRKNSKIASLFQNPEMQNL